MTTNFLNLVSAELFQMRKRTSRWILLAVWTLMGVIFGYLFPYLTLGDNAFAEGSPAMALLPERFVAGALSDFPFYGGAIALIVGVLTIGSEYGWNTYKTLYTQRPGRGKVFSAKILALIVTMIPFAISVFVMSALGSIGVAMLENQPIAWPAVSDLFLALGAGWLILVVWTVVGVVLATLTRGTSLAIGIGIIWALALEGMLAAFAGSLAWLEWTNDIMLRSNAYSLVKPLTGQFDTDGPGYFAGPYVSVTQSLIVLMAMSAVALGGSYLLIKRRDVA